MTIAAPIRTGESARPPVTQWVRPPVAVAATASSSPLLSPPLSPPESPVEPAAPVVNEAAVSALVGRNLRRLRRQHRLSLEALSRQSGVSRAMLGQVEQGKSVPSIKTLWQVAQAFGVSVSWFLETGRDARVLLMPPPADSPAHLPHGEAELRSLQQAGDAVREAFYELRLAPGATLSLPAAPTPRQVNVAVSAGVVQVDVEDAVHLVRPRESLQYEAVEALIWRNPGHAEAQAFVVIRPVSRFD